MPIGLFSSPARVRTMDPVVNRRTFYYFALSPPVTIYNHSKYLLGFQQYALASVFMGFLDFCAQFAPSYLLLTMQ